MDFTHYGAHQICFWKRFYSPHYNDWETDKPRFSWDDFHLIPQKRPQVTFPTPNFSMVPIPAASVRYDITEILPGGLIYNSVSGTWGFVIDHTKWGDQESWIQSQRALEKYFDGSQFIVEIVDDCGKLYSGRVWISAHESGSENSTVTLSYTFTSGDFEIPKDLFFRIRFLDYYDVVLQEDYLRLGDTPIYYKELPEDEYLKFDHWEPPIRPVDGTQDYKASAFKTVSTHPIVFYDEQGKIIEERQCVPSNMDAVLFNMKPIIEMLGVHDILLEDFWRVPENMSFEYEQDYRDGFPHHIVIERLPDKTSYANGEEIDFTGIVVKGYNDNGSLWTNGPFSDGVIAPRLLRFPVKTAEYDPENRLPAGYTSDLPLDSAGLLKSVQRIDIDSVQDRYSDGRRELFIKTEKDKWWYSANVFTPMDDVPESERYLSVIFDENRHISVIYGYGLAQPSTDAEVRWRSLNKDGKIAVIDWWANYTPTAPSYSTLSETLAPYYLNCDYQAVENGFFDNTTILYAFITSRDTMQYALNIMWTLIYGSISTPSSKQKVPVQFRRKGITVEAEFEIDVTE